VSGDLETFKFNTMLAALMEYNNYLIKAKTTPIIYTAVWKEAIETLVLLLAPSAPHLAEELWHRLGHTDSVHLQPWPQWNETLAAEEMITVVVQINGKVRDKFEAPADIEEQAAIQQALTSPRVARFLDGKEIVKAIYVTGKLVNIVVN